MFPVHCTVPSPCRDVLACWEGGGWKSGIQSTPVAVLSAPEPTSLINACLLSGPQVLHLYCDTCSVPICRECTMGRHGGHSFIYLQEALQDSRALTIQLLADAQQGRQAIQVSPSPPVITWLFPLFFLAHKTFPIAFQMACMDYWADASVRGPWTSDPRELT